MPTTDAWVDTGMKPLALLKASARHSRARRAVWEDTTIAEAPDTMRVDGYEYFPADAVRWDLLEESERTSVCPWKGVASYFDVVVDGRRLPGAAWTYRTPSQAAAHIAGRVAFWQGVRVVDA